MEAYVLKNHNTVAKYIATGLILDLCKETVQMMGHGLKKGGGIRREWKWQERGWRRQQQKRRGGGRRREMRRTIREVIHGTTSKLK